MRKTVFILLLCIVMILVITDEGSLVLGQETTANPGNTSEVAQSRGIQSFWELTKYAKEFRWPLFFTFIIGMVLIVKKFVDLVLDWQTSRKIYRTDFLKFKRREQIEQFVVEHHCIASSLILMLLRTLRTSPDADKFNEEVEKFTENQKQHFTTFQNRMSFWSDTAGALGLLGTVWGMFITFFKGDMDKQAILSGMGIALITTLMGLVISVILNFFTTEVSGLFNRILNRLSDIADRLWMRIVAIQPLRAASPSLLATTEVSQTEQSGTAERKSQIKTRTEKESGYPKVGDKAGPDDYEMIAISGDQQKSLLNRKIKKPLVVELYRLENGKRHKVTGEIIIYSVADQMGKFDNGKDEIMIPTNADGQAEAFFTPVRQNGDCRVIASHETLPVRPVYFTINVQSLKPFDIRLKRGNNQSGPSGATLADPFIVEVVDEENHPVPSCMVAFKVNMGNGTFPNGKTSIEIPTDESGTAQVKLILGREPGFNSVQAETTNLKGKHLTIQALGQ